MESSKVDTGPGKNPEHDTDHPLRPLDPNGDPLASGGGGNRGGFNPLALYSLAKKGLSLLSNGDGDGTAAASYVGGRYTANNSGSSNGSSTGATQALTANDLINRVASRSDNLQSRADQFFGLGEDLYGQLESYIKPLLQGDRQAMLEAVAPEVRGVTSQYDTAYKAISELSPRGGGRNAALANVRGEEAGKVGDLIAGSRQKAVDATSDLFKTIATLGMSEDAASQTGLATAIQALMQKSGQDKASAASWGQAIGSIVAAYLLKDQ